MAPTPPGPLPAHARLGPVHLRVADVTRTLDWYVRVTGASLRGEDGGRARLGPEGGPTLLTLREVRGAQPVPRSGRLGLYHHALLLPSRSHLASFVRHLDAIGEPWAGSDHLFSEAVYLTDPDGLTLEVYADRPRSAWRWREGQLEGAVDPLDLADLLAQPHDPWRALPAGTTLGHVHLFVDDLVRAERFHVQGLGFEPTTRRFPGALFVAAGGYHHHVGLNTWAARAPLAGPQDAGLDAWTIVLAAPHEVNAVADRLAALGIEVRAVDSGIEATDPWGIGVRIQAGPEHD